MGTIEESKVAELETVENDIYKIDINKEESTILTQEQMEQQHNKKIEILKEEINELNLDEEFLKKLLRQIVSKSKQPNMKDKHINNLLELQSFQADSQQIWSAKISNDGRYLATGGKSGVIKLFEIYSLEESIDNYEYKGIASFLKFINESAFRVYTEHSNDIIELRWSPKQFHILLSASLDHSVIMWDINKDSSLYKFDHSAMVTCIDFCPNSEDNVFCSGCFDKIVRIWSPSKRKVVDYINVQEYTTSIAYFPTGDMIAVGSYLGKCSIYECIPKLKYSYSFDCKNKNGKYASGRKITNIDFLNKNAALVTTNDSRIRLVNVNDGKIIQKYKGYLNDEYMIRAFYEEIYDLVISASDDGNVYVWKKIE
jgi:WD40 repeat protein